jgi:hypothetical protein
LHAPYQQIASGVWFKAIIDCPVLHPADLSKPPPRSGDSSPVVPMRQDDFFESGLLVSVKLFDGFVNRIFAGPELLIAHHSETTISAISYSFRAIPRLVVLNSVPLRQEISAVTVAHSGCVFAATATSLTAFTPELKVQSEFALSTPISHIATSGNDHFVLATRGHSSLALKDMRSFQLVADFDFEGALPVCLVPWPDKSLALLGTDTDRVYLMDLRIMRPVNVQNFRNPKILVPFRNDLSFAVASDSVVQFFDARMPDPRMTVKGQIDCALNWQERLLILNDSGTFMVDPRAKNQVRSLVDGEFPTNVAPGKSDWVLPRGYRRSLHSHMFQMTSADVNNGTGVCVSGDCAGYVHLWSPGKL